MESYAVARSVACPKEEKRARRDLHLKIENLYEKGPKESMRHRYHFFPILFDAVDISDEEYTGELEEMVEVMKGAVAMDIWVIGRDCCCVSLYCHNGATRKARLQLSALTMSSEQSRTRATGYSIWLNTERCKARLKHGTRRAFVFSSFGDSFRDPHESKESALRNLGLSIAQNANSVEWLQLEAQAEDYPEKVFFKNLFLLDVWKEAFPSLQGAHLIVEKFNDRIDVSSHLMKHVSGLVQYVSCRQLVTRDTAIPPAYLDWIGSMIRNNVIEKIEFLPHLLGHATLLDDTLRSVRSFQVDIENRTSWDLLAMSFERTKAEGDKLERLGVYVNGYCFRPYDCFSATAVATILRSRPNLQVLHVNTIPLRGFVALFQAVASTTLTAFTCDCCDMFPMRVEAVVAVVGDILQHSTIRVLELSIDGSNDPDSLVQGIAEGLRATRLRRFHLAIPFGRVSIASMTKLYESVRENRSLMDIQLNGPFWDPWREPRGHDLPHAPPCPFSFFEFLSSRNQYLSQLLLPYDYTLPVGLWPLINSK